MRPFAIALHLQISLLVTAHCDAAFSSLASTKPRTFWPLSASIKNDVESQDTKSASSSTTSKKQNEQQVINNNNNNTSSNSSSDGNSSKNSKNSNTGMFPPPRAPLLIFPRERRRKLVDRSNVFTNELPDLPPPHVENTMILPPSPPPLPLPLPLQTSSLESASLETETAFLEENDEELCYLDEFTTSAGQTCFVSHSSHPLPNTHTNNNKNNNNNNNNNSPNTLSSASTASLPFPTEFPPMAIDLTMKYLPFVMPLLAYSTYEPTAKIFERTVEFISNNKWVSVDGGQYQATIITPAINGLVVPSMSLLFATLTANTINTLRQRQLQIRTSLNTEANDLRMVSTMVDSLPSELSNVKNHLREYLIQYASRVIAESKPGLSVDHQMFIGSMDSEINGFLGVWNKLSMVSYGTVYLNTMQPEVVVAKEEEEVVNMGMDMDMDMDTEDNEEDVEESKPTTTTTTTTRSRSTTKSKSKRKAKTKPKKSAATAMQSTTTQPTVSSRVPYPITETHFLTLESQLSLTPHQRHTISPFLSPPIFSEAYDALTRLRHERSIRLSALQSTYPTLHYVILGLLASSICTVFLMETNQELLIFLNAIQLKLLWAMLIGTFSALGVVNYDMIDPFRGSYNVAVSVDQFYTIRESIRATIQMEQDQSRRNAQE